MDTKRAYKRCGLNGKGTLTASGRIPKAEFEVLDISASGVSISTSADLNIHDIVDLNIRFNGNIIEMVIDANARVVRKDGIDSENIYGIEFISMSNSDRVEIDEIIAYSCSTSELSMGINSCDHGRCVISKK